MLDSDKSRCSREGRELMTESHRPWRELVPVKERCVKAFIGRIGGIIVTSAEFWSNLNSFKPGKFSVTMIVQRKMALCS